MHGESPIYIIGCVGPDVCRLCEGEAREHCEREKPVCSKEVFSGTKIDSEIRARSAGCADLGEQLIEPVVSFPGIHQLCRLLTRDTLILK